MFGLELLSKLIGGEPPAIESGRCLRRFRRATCQKCTEKCPTEALRLDGLGPRIAADCSGCGVCVSVCPTGTFSLGATPPSGLSAAIRGTGDVEVSCSIGRVRAGGLKVPCLGYLSPGLLLALEAGRRRVQLNVGGCAECSLKAAFSLIEDMVTRTNAILGAFSLPPTVSMVRPGAAAMPSAGEGSTYSRRELFARLTGRSAEVGGNALTEWRRQLPFVGAGEDEDALLDHLGHLLAIQLKRLASDAGDCRGLLPLSRPAVEERCDVCGVCVSACPSGALTKTESSSRSYLRWQAVICWYCGLCKDVCPLGVLDREEGLPAEAVRDEARVILAAVDVACCSGCGRRFACPQGGKLCPHCRVDDREDRFGGNPFGLGRPNIRMYAK